jgi:hypothetical protein
MTMGLLLLLTVAADACLRIQRPNRERNRLCSAYPRPNCRGCSTLPTPVARYPRCGWLVPLAPPVSSTVRGISRRRDEDARNAAKNNPFWKKQSERAGNYGIKPSATAGRRVRPCARSAVAKANRLCHPRPRFQISRRPWKLPRLSPSTYCGAENPLSAFFSPSPMDWLDKDLLSCLSDGQEPPHW